MTETENEKGKENLLWNEEKTKAEYKTPRRSLKRKLLSAPLGAWADQLVFDSPYKSSLLYVYKKNKNKDVKQTSWSSRINVCKSHVDNSLPL